MIIYCIVGSLFFNFFHNESFNLYINGNGGFVGNYLNQKFVNSLINPYKNFAYFLLILTTLILFLFSINFKPKEFIRILKR